MLPHVLVIMTDVQRQIIRSFETIGKTWKTSEIVTGMEKSAAVLKNGLTFLQKYKGSSHMIPHFRP